MSYQNDPNLNRRPVRDDDPSYTGWIVGGIVALAVIAGIFMMFGRTDSTSTASNTSPNRPAVTAPATTPPPTPGTTGAGSTSPPPAAR
jgi:hypothetical protein